MSLRAIKRIYSCMNTLKLFFYQLPQNIAAVFRGYNLIFHVAFILLTYVLVVRGFDWFFFEHTRSPLIFIVSIPSALLGFFIPVFLPLVLVISGARRQKERIKNTGYALAQSGAMAWVISSAYKAITGRAHPEVFADASMVVMDLSRDFQFGFFERGIFWGWPSSHTTIAFAIAMTAFTLYPSMKMRVAALLTALYIGLGVSTTIHWFSDVTAGALLGTCVGIVVGNAFKTRITKHAS
mgnify:FL=1